MRSHEVSQTREQLAEELKSLALDKTQHARERIAAAATLMRLLREVDGNDDTGDDAHAL